MRFATLFLVGLGVGCSEFELNDVNPAEAQPERILEAEPGFLNFGDQAIGDTVTQSFLVRSVGEQPVTIRGGLVQGSGAFTLQWQAAGLRLEPNETSEVFVQYTPESLDDEAKLFIVSDAEQPELIVPINGALVSPAIRISPSPVEFFSGEGEAVLNNVTLESVGTSTLEISDSLLLGEDFVVYSSPLPVALEPGESTTMTLKYTPRLDDAPSQGELWVQSNAISNPDLVPLIGEIKPPCLGLGEARDRGILDIAAPFGSDIILTNTSESGSNAEGDGEVSEDGYDICIDRWYIYLTVESQDAGAGDPFFDAGGEYPLGTITLSPGDSVAFNYTNPAGPAWWCVEETQVTAPTNNFIFLGAAVPDPLLDLMLNDEQTNPELRQDDIWKWQTFNPVPIVGRYTHYFELAPNDSATVLLTTLNMGSVGTVATITETIPPMFAASNFSRTPTFQRKLSDGSIEYTFDVPLKPRILTPIDVHTIYDEVTISYDLTIQDTSCRGRQQIPQPTSTWADSSNIVQVTQGSPLIVSCTEDAPPSE